MSKFFHFFIISILCFSCYRGFAQNYPVYNSYYVNPYLFNPAEAATDFTYIYVNHRRQWLGIEGAPVVSTINFNTMINETHAGVGAKLSSFQRGLLSTNDLSLTYAYGVPITKKNTFFFGMSGGAITTRIDVANATDPSDPVLAKYLPNNIQPTANFGMLYRAASGINFGLTLPQLFAPSYNAPSNFSGTAFSPFDNLIVTAYYKRKVAGKIVNGSKKGIKAKVKTGETSAPLEFYVMYKYAKTGNSQLEILTKLNLSENFWLGAAYRQSYGFVAITGITINRFLLGYSYELGSQPESGFSSGTHEIQLGLRLGNQKKFKRTSPVFRSGLKTNSEQHVARFQQTVKDTEHVETPADEKKKYFVVIKGFSDFNGADAYKKKLLDQKYNANIFYYEKEKKYYVHVLESSTAADANEEARNLKKYTKLKDARVLTVQVSSK